jgi:NAD(P)-dependent dehydrogenase (short-subunit alcohol dehydrogenase family)
MERDDDPIQPGNVAVVTGAASGIGRALATAFADEGMRVVLADVNEGNLRATEAQLSDAGRDVHPVVCDTSSEASVHELAQVTMERYGAAHILCNNAGVVGKGDAWRGPFANWEWVVGVNLYGVVHGIRAFLPIMEEQGIGHIVNTASMAGLLAVPGQPPYNATKSAVVAVSESLFIELRQSGSPVRVSALCPAFVRTNLMHGQVWDPRLGAEPPISENKVNRAMEEFFEQGIEQRGVEPAIIAAEVIDAIRGGRFWILTHPEARHAPVERMQRAERQLNPA